MSRVIAVVLALTGGAMVSLQLYLEATVGHAGYYDGGHLFAIGGTIALIGLARLVTKHIRRYLIELLEQHAPWARLVLGGFLVFAGIYWCMGENLSQGVFGPMALGGGILYIARTFSSPPPHN